MSGVIPTAMTDRGIILHPKTTVESVIAKNGGRKVQLSDGSSLELNEFMAATGRRPNTANLGLSAIGVDCGEQGEIKVDANSRTGVQASMQLGM